MRVRTRPHSSALPHPATVEAMNHKPDGRYSLTATELDDEWEEVTATETPAALQSERKDGGVPKRSGVYARTAIEAEAESLGHLIRRCSGEAGS